MAYQKHQRDRYPSWAAKFIRAERLKKNITQEELARRSGVRVGHIRLIEWQCNSPRFETMEKLINTLGHELHAVPNEDIEECLEADIQDKAMRLEKLNTDAYRETHEVLESLEKRANRNDLSLRQACEEAGVAYSTVTRWRSGFSSPTLKSITRIQKALQGVEENLETRDQINWIMHLSGDRNV
jgi:transcriptional regulator with XRE-family HTH domain